MYFLDDTTPREQKFADPEKRLLNPDLSDIEVFVYTLHNLSESSRLSEFKERIEQLIKTTDKLSEVVGSKTNQYFQVPRLYLTNFIYKCNTDPTLDQIKMGLYFSDVLFTCENYLVTIRKMVDKLTLQEKGTVQAPLLTQVGCTIDKHNRENVLQKAYYCETCGITDNGMICEGCRRVCHSSHKVTYRGILTGFCDCRFDTNGCKLMENCTLKHTGNDYIKQPGYACHSCNMNISKGKILCKFCVEKCHKGHTVEYMGMIQGFCDCDEMYSFCLLHKMKSS